MENQEEVNRERKKNGEMDNNSFIDMNLNKYRIRSCQNKMRIIKIDGPLTCEHVIGRHAATNDIWDLRTINKFVGIGRHDQKIYLFIMKCATALFMLLLEHT